MDITEKLLQDAADQFKTYASEIDAGGVPGDLPDGDHIVDIVDLQTELTNSGTARGKIILKVVGSSLDGKESVDSFQFPLDLKSLTPQARVTAGTGLSVFDQKYSLLTGQEQLLRTMPKDQALPQLVNLIASGEAKKNIVGQRWQVNVTHRKNWPRFAYLGRLGAKSSDF